MAGNGPNSKAFSQLLTNNFGKYETIDSASFFTQILSPLSNASYFEEFYSEIKKVEVKYGIQTILHHIINFIDSLSNQSTLALYELDKDGVKKTKEISLFQERILLYLQQKYLEYQKYRNTMDGFLTDLSGNKTIFNSRYTDLADVNDELNKSNLLSLKSYSDRARLCKDMLPQMYSIHDGVDADDLFTTDNAKEVVKRSIKSLFVKVDEDDGLRTQEPSQNTKDYCFRNIIDLLNSELTSPIFEQTQKVLREKDFYNYAPQSSRKKYETYRNNPATKKYFFFTKTGVGFSHTGKKDAIDIRLSYGPFIPDGKREKVPQERLSILTDCINKEVLCIILGVKDIDEIYFEQEDNQIIENTNTLTNDGSYNLPTASNIANAFTITGKQGENNAPATTSIAESLIGTTNNAPPNNYTNIVEDWIDNKGKQGDQIDGTSQRQETPNNVLENNPKVLETISSTQVSEISSAQQIEPIQGKDLKDKKEKELGEEVTGTEPIEEKKIDKGFDYEGYFKDLLTK